MPETEVKSINGRTLCDQTARDAAQGGLKYSAQTLTDAQKKQARDNISAVSEEEFSGINPISSIAPYYDQLGLGLPLAYFKRGYINGTTWLDTGANLNYSYYFIPIKPGDNVRVIRGARTFYYGALRNNNLVNGEAVPYSTAEGWTTGKSTNATNISFVMPSDAYYLSVYNGNNSEGTDSFPQKIYINGVDVLHARDSLRTRMDMQSSLCTIFPSINGLPEIKVQDRTLTFKSLTTFYYYDRYFYTTSNDVVVSLVATDSRAIKVVFDTETKTFSAVAYNYFEDKKILVALVQFTNDWSKIVNVAIHGGYLIDGMRYGVETAAPSACVKTVNHRGYQDVAPENTLPAFQLSKRNGFDWIETDVQFTSDAVPVILHDRAINRTARNSDGTEISDTINIDSITYEEALTYDFGIAKSSAYAGTPIPTLEECMTLCRNIGLKVRLELKGDTVSKDNLPDIIDVIRKCGMIKNVEFASFSPTLLEFLAENHPGYDLCYIINGAVNSTVISNAKALRTDKNHVVVACDRYNVTLNGLSLLQAEEIPLDIYTITAAWQITEANKYVTGFTSNRYDAAKVLRDNYI